MIRKSRKSALEHYQVNAGGEYVYTGRYLSFQTPGKTRKRALGELWGITGIMALCAVGAGCVPAPGTGNTFYVLLPLMVGIILSIACVWTLLQITLGGDPMKEYVYRDSVEKFRGRLTAAAVFSGVTAAGLGLYLLLHWRVTVADGVVLLLEAGAMVLAMLARKRFSGLKWAE